jgi:hypothetical protein
MLAGTAFAMLGMIAGDMLGTPRVLFAFARDGLLPRVLGRVHPQTHTPYVAILSYAALAIILALTGSFTELAVLATLASAGLYVAACIATWLLVRRGGALAGVPLNFRWLGATAAVGAGSMLLLIALASRIEIAGLAVLIAGEHARLSAAEVDRRREQPELKPLHWGILSPADPGIRPRPRAGVGGRPEGTVLPTAPRGLVASRKRRSNSRLA